MSGYLYHNKTQARMTRKYNNHRLQTKPRSREEETKNTTATQQQEYSWSKKYKTKNKKILNIDAD